MRFLPLLGSLPSLQDHRPDQGYILPLTRGLYSLPLGLVLSLLLALQSQPDCFPAQHFPSNLQSFLQLLPVCPNFFQVRRSKGEHLSKLIIGQFYELWLGNRLLSLGIDNQQPH